MSRLNDARRWSKSMGPRLVWQLGFGLAASRAAGRGHRMHVRPSLDDMLLAAGGTFQRNAEEFLRALGWAGAPSEELREEYRRAAEALTRQYRRTELAFPASFRVEEETSLWLYALVRLLRPQMVLETGVANGHSSWLILAALTRNGSGELHSFDIDPKAGGLVNDTERWVLHVSQVDTASTSFRRVVSSLGKIDLFFHDGDHRYLSQLFEYRLVWRFMSSGGVLASDDVDDSRAFFDFSEEVGNRPSLLFDNTKVVGAHRLP